MVADMAASLDAAQLLVYRAAWLKDNGLPHNKEASMAKKFATDTGMEVCTNCVQLLLHITIQVSANSFFIGDCGFRLWGIVATSAIIIIERYYEGGVIFECSLLRMLCCWAIGTSIIFW